MPQDNVWLHNFTLAKAQSDEKVSQWTQALSDLLINAPIEDTSLQDISQVPAPKLNGSKEVTITEARKFIRHERFQELGVKKKENILTREIEQFRDRLELARNVNKLELESAEELALLERRHRQIKAASLRSLSHEVPLLNNNLALEECVQLGARKVCNQVSKYCQIMGKELRGNKEAQSNVHMHCRSAESEDCNKGQRKSIEVGDKSKSQPSKSCRGEHEPSEIISSRTGEKKSAEPPVPRGAKEEKPEQKALKGTHKLEMSSASRIRKRTNFLNNFVAYKSKLYYWSKWKIYVNEKKKERGEEKMWMEKINNFMQRLNERSKHQAPTAEVVEQAEKANKLKRKAAPAKSVKMPAKVSPVTQDEDLQDIAQAVAKSTAETQHQLRSKSVQSLHPSLKGKAKLIRLITTVVSKPELNQPEPIEHPHPDILEDMDRRHLERKQRLAEIQDKKRLIEEEKDRIAKAKYEQQLLEAGREKRRKVQEFREKLRKERVEQEKRKAEWILMKELNETALRHYRRKLLTRHGFHPWQSLVMRRRTKKLEAEDQNERRVQRVVFTAWKQALEQIQAEKEAKALIFRNKFLLKTYMTEWARLCWRRRQQEQVADDWHDYVLTRTTLQAWQDFIFIEQKESQEKWERAGAFYRRTVTTKCLQHWMLLPQVLYLEREKEHRKREWREKVQQVLPDFRPIPLLEF